MIASTHRRRLLNLLCAAAACSSAPAVFAQEMTIIAGSTLSVPGCQATNVSGPICNGGYSGDNNAAIGAQLDLPYGVAFAPNGYVYVADGLNGAIRVIYNNGNIGTYAKVNGTGQGTQATAVTVDSVGNVYYGDSGGGVYENGSGLATWNAPISSSIEALATDSQGNLYVLTSVEAEFFNIYLVNSRGTGLLAGTTTTGGLVNDSLYGLAVDGSGNLYTFDTRYHNSQGQIQPSILEFVLTTSPAGVTSVASFAPIASAPTGFSGISPAYGQSLALDPLGNFYINEGSLIVKFTPGSSSVPAYAGTGTSGYNSGFSVGGVALQATKQELNHVQGIWVTGGGALYIADTENNLVRVVTNTAGCQECGPTTLTLTDQLPLLGLGFAVNPVTQQLYVSNFSTSAVNVYDTKTDALITTIPVGNQPTQVVVDSLNNVIYVANQGSATVSVINGITNTLSANVPVAASATTIAVDPALDKAYAANSGGTSVNVIIGPSGPSNLTPASAGATIPNLGVPSALAVDTVHNLVYLRCFCLASPLGGENYSMAIIDATTDTVTKVVSEFEGESTDIPPDSIAVDETTGNVLIADTEQQTVTIWSYARQAFEVPLGQAIYPYHVTIDSTHEVAYFTDGYGDSFSLNLQTFQQLSLSSIARPQSACSSLANVFAVDPTTDQAYMTTCPVTQGGVTSVLLSLIDGPSGATLATLLLPAGNVNNGQFAIAVNPLTHVVYVGESITGKIDVINGPPPGPPSLPTSLALGVSPEGPVGLGQTVTLTATVTFTGTAPIAGTVVFFDGSTTLGIGTLNGLGQASFPTSSLALGTHTLSATFSGSGTYQGSSGSATLSVLESTSTTLTASAAFLNSGQTLTLTAVVSANGPAAPSANVTFTGAPAGGTLATTVRSAGALTQTYAFAPAVGSYSFTATYPGDTSYAGSSSSAVSVTVSPPPTDTETILVTDMVTFLGQMDSENILVDDLVTVAPLVSNYIGPVAWYSASTVGFSGSTATTQTLTLINAGSAPIVFSGQPSISAGYGIAQTICTNGATTLPSSLASANQCTFTISWTDATKATGTLVFTDNAPLSSPPSATVSSSTYTQTINLSGSGVSVVTLEPLGTVNLGTIAEMIAVTDSLVPNGAQCSPGTVVIVDVSGVQTIINEALGLLPPADDLNNDGGVNIVDVQIGSNAALGLGCIAK